jgi:hypothetical protein
MDIEVIVGLALSLIVLIMFIYGVLKREKEEKLKKEDNCRNTLMSFSEILENITNIINKYYPTDDIVNLRFEVAIFILYSMEGHYSLSQKWFRDDIIAYISNNIKHFTREDYEQRWKLYRTNPVDIEKRSSENKLTVEDITEYTKHDHYMKFDILFFLIEKNIQNGVKRKLFRNKNSDYRKTYLPIEGISREISKLEKIMNA